VLGDLDPRVSPPGEIVLRSEFYDYAAKYEEGGMTLVVPARIGEAASAEVARIATEAFTRADCSGLARADFFVEGERVLLNELNTMPGLHRDQRLREAVGGRRARLPAPDRGAVRRRARAPRARAPLPLLRAHSVPQERELGHRHGLRAWPGSAPRSVIQRR